jgi:hypothetical protein
MSDGEPTNSDRDGVEPPPVGTTLGFGIYSDPVPFGAPPAEQVDVADDDLPWELREAVPFEDDGADAAPGEQQPRPHKHHGHRHDDDDPTFTGQLI